MSVFIPLFDWDAAERVARYTGFDPEKSELARELLWEAECQWDLPSGMPEELKMKGHIFAALLIWVDIVYNDHGIPMPKWIYDWVGEALAVRCNEFLFFDLDPPPHNWPDGVCPYICLPPAKHGGKGQ